MITPGSPKHIALIASLIAAVALVITGALVLQSKNNSAVDSTPGSNQSVSSHTPSPSTIFDGKTVNVQFSTPTGWNTQSKVTLNSNGTKYESSCAEDGPGWQPRGFSEVKLTDFPGQKDEFSYDDTIYTFPAAGLAASKYDAACDNDQYWTSRVDTLKSVFNLNSLPTDFATHYLPFIWSVYNSDEKYYQPHYVQSSDGLTRGVAFFSNESGNGGGFSPHYGVELYNQQHDQLILMSFDLKTTPKITQINLQSGTAQTDSEHGAALKAYQDYMTDATKGFPQVSVEEFQPTALIDSVIIKSITVTVAQ